jgi:putative tricarboxylic transport membrane protein
MQRADIACAAVILGIGGLVMFDSIRLDVGWGMEGPRAGFFPFLMSLGLILSSLAVIVRAVRRKGTSASNDPFIPVSAVRPLMQVVVPASLMVFLSEYLGLYVAAGLYMAFSMRAIGGHRWMIVLPTSILLPAGFYYLFDKVFLIAMPAGTLRALLGF